MFVVPSGAHGRVDQMIELTRSLLLALFGLVAGSFLSVCIHRLPHGRSVVTPSSHCPCCGEWIRWFDNIPVFGYLALRGQCRHCHAPINPMYPAVEVVTPVLFLLQYQEVGFDLLLVTRLLFTGAMIVLFAIDLQHRVLPNVVTIPGICSGLLFSCFVQPGWFDAVLGVVIGGVTLLAISEVYYRVRGEEGLGMGDVKMLAMIGAFLGWQSMLVTLVLASFLGSIIGICAMRSASGGRKFALPLGSFLAVASIVVTLVGEPVIAWYMSFY